MLREFYGVLDARRAAIAEHKSYLVSASSQLCAYHVLRLVGDDRGLALLQEYQGVYGQYFAMFCENARAVRRNEAYLLRELISDARAEAGVLRERLLRGDGLPSAPVAVRPLGVARPLTNRGKPLVSTF